MIPDNWPSLRWTAPDRAVTELDRSWWSWSGPHGGVLASLAVAAAERAGGGQQVRELSAQFLAPAGEGPIELEVRSLKQGRSSTVLAVDAASGGRSCLAATALLGKGWPGPSVRLVPAPPVPPLDRCPAAEMPVDVVPFTARIEFRPTNDAAFLGGSTRPEYVGWLRLRDGRPLDAQALAVLVDALAPGLYATLTTPIPVPTVAMSVQFAHPVTVPDDGWALVRITTRSAGDGWCVDDTDVWAADGTLLASARQTRLVVEPRTAA